MRQEKQKKERKYKKGLGLVLAVACTVAALTSQAVGTTLAASQSAETIATDLAPSGICQGTDNKLYVSDSDNHAIYQVSGSKVSLVAGVSGKSGSKNGTAKAALFNTPWGLAVYNKGVAIADSQNNVIRLLKSGKVTTIAGTGKAKLINKKGTKAAFSRPTGLAAGSKGELYIADTGNNCIRMMDKKGNMTVFAGSTKGKAGCKDGTTTKALFLEPTGLFYSSGTLYVADSGNHRICQIKKGKVTTIAGSKKGKEGDSTGKGTSALLSNPQGVYYYKNTLYIADTGNASVKKLAKGTVKETISAYSLQDGLLPSAPRAFYVKSGYLYIGDIFANQLFKVKL